MRIDVHQHLWTERLFGALAERSEAPRLRSRESGWELELAHEPPFALPGPHDPIIRAERLREQGYELALVSLSGALGIERLADAEARSLIEAWDRDADELPDPLRAWGSVSLADPDPDDVDRALARGRVGITLPADALASPWALEQVGPLLDRLGALRAPLLVHPGPGGAGAWLPALTSYVASLSAAWHCWALHGRARHPKLRVVFAALAGLAPLHSERLAARVPDADGERALHDPRTFYDTSSYGPRAIKAMLRAVGPRALVRGSDWPYAEATELPTSLPGAVAEGNAHALLGPRAPVAAA